MTENTNYGMQCSGCKKPLSGRTLEALNQTWHIDCWTCAECQKPFFDGTNLNTFYHKGDQVVCGACADIGVPCGACGTTLTFREPGGILSAAKRFYHLKCFLCTSCKSPIQVLKLSKSQQIYCDKCAIPGESLTSSLPDQFATSELAPTSNATPPTETKKNDPSTSEIKKNECWTCKKVIEGRITTAMDHSFHPSCFVCFDCKSPFGGKSFFTVNGNPICQECHVKAAPVCGGCGKKVTGRFLTAVEKRWHSECFVCDGCRKSLEGGKYKLIPSRPGIPFCSDCAEKLNVPEDVY